MNFFRPAFDKQMTSLCRFAADIAGRPREGVHKWRIPILDWALFDTLLTVAAALALGRGRVCASVVWLLVLLAVGAVLHRVLCVRTALSL